MLLGTCTEKLFANTEQLRAHRTTPEGKTMARGRAKMLFAHPVRRSRTLILQVSHIPGPSVNTAGVHSCENHQSSSLSATQDALSVGPQWPTCHKAATKFLTFVLVSDSNGMICIQRKMGWFRFRQTEIRGS